MEGAFDAAVRANVEKDGQLAFLREQLAVVAAQQPQHQEAHTASAAAGEEAADAEISELRSQLAALQSGDVPIAGLPEVGEGACSSQVNAASATLLALTSSQVQAPAEGPVLSLQQLAAGWLSDDGEQPQAASTDPVSSGSARESMPIAVQDAIVLSALIETPEEPLNCLAQVRTAPLKDHMMLDAVSNWSLLRMCGRAAYFAAFMDLF